MLDQGWWVYWAKLMRHVLVRVDAAARVRDQPKAPGSHEGKQTPWPKYENSKLISEATP